MPGILRRTRVYAIPGIYPATAWVFCRFPQFCLREFASDFAPDQLSDSGKLASFQNGAPSCTLCSLEISGNAKCWGRPSELCFPFCLPENLVQAKPRRSRRLAAAAAAATAAPATPHSTQPFSWRSTQAEDVHGLPHGEPRVLFSCTRLGRGCIPPTCSRRRPPASSTSPRTPRALKDSRKKKN